MALTDMNLWDPNARLGDLQLMAMASWMSHEDKRAVEIRKLMEKEQDEPLMIRANSKDPIALISTHRQLAADRQSAPKHINDQAQAIAHFKDIERLVREDCIHACMRRWDTLPA